MSDAVIQNDRAWIIELDKRMKIQEEHAAMRLADVDAIHTRLRKLESAARKRRKK